MSGPELEITDQVAGLAGHVAAHLEHVVDGAAPGGAVQAYVDGLIAELEAETRAELMAGRPNPDLLLDEGRWPGIGAWAAMRPLSVALYPAFAAGGIRTLGEGLRVDDIDAPLVGASSAHDLLRRTMGPGSADLVRRHHRCFVDTPIGPELRLLLAGCLDARALRTRAMLAARLAVEHLAGRATAPSDRSGLVGASLGCGPGGSALCLAAALQSAGRPLARLYLVDHDPLALCTSRRLIDRADLVTEVLVRLRSQAYGRPSRMPQVWDFTAERLDVIEVPSLLHYLPARAAVGLLIRLRDMVAADGVVVLGSMLRPRPQQVFFQQVLRWPRLRQRTLGELVDLVGLAGWPLARASFVVPAREPLYAVGVLRP